MGRRWIMACIFWWWHCFGAVPPGALRINEFMASNIQVQLNSDSSDFVDWIELYNPGDAPVDLEGLFLTDDLDSPLEWPLPEDTAIQPGAFFIVWADGLDRGSHASFKLADEGGQIGLFGRDGTFIDTVTYGIQRDDVSRGRFPDGGSSWRFFHEFTFGRPNSAFGIDSNIQVSPPDVSPEGGLYPGGQTVALEADSGAAIRYTVDGSLPTDQSTRYSQPIPVLQTTALRVRAFREGRLPSRTVTHTYIIHEPSTLPVVSITTPPEFLFDGRIGITAGIPVADSVGAIPPFDPGANFWKDWERPVHIEYFEFGGSLGFSQDAGIAVFGGFFGRQIRQKAFTLFARGKYGDSQFEYPLFPEKPIRSFKRFILRCSSNDFNSTFIRDAMMNSLVIGQMDVDYQAYHPALVYINGSFWGLYNIREKTNQYYPESNYQVDADDVDLVVGIDSTAHGDGGNYRDLLQYVQTNDMTAPVNYQYVQTQMDVGEFMNYLITEIYVCNHDWLHQNIKCWREHGAAGKWRWLLYDMDWGFGGQDVRMPEPYAQNTFQWIFEQGRASVLFQRCVLNSDFRDEFAQRFATHLNLTFHPERVQRIIDGIAGRIAAEMPRQIERWGAIPSMDYWQGQLERLREFARERPRFVFDHLEQALHLAGKTELTLQVSDSSAGRITVNEVPVEKTVFTGLWFRNIAMRVESHPKRGWRFVRWEGPVPSEAAGISLTLTEPTRLFAVFEPSGLPSIAISEIHYHPSAPQGEDDDDYEFVELLNLGDERVDISGYHFTNGISFTFPQGSHMDQGEYIVVAKKRETYADNGYQVFQCTSGKLDNAGEELRFCSPEGTVVDSVRYDDQPPWPTDPDGNGPSLELKNPCHENDAASAWTAGEKTGGTPGRGPLTGIEETDRAVLGFILFPSWPNPFNSKTTIQYSLPEKGKVAVKIFNSMGQEVAFLVDESQSPGIHRLDWEPGSMSSGIFIVHLSAGKYQKARKILYIK